MPMRKIYPLWSNVLLIWLAALFFSPSSLAGQSMTCFQGLQASLDDSCRVVIDATTFSPGLAPPLTDYELTITAKDGSSLDGVQYDSSGTYVQGNVGSIIRFTEPGSFTVSVKRLSSGISCWGSLDVENKLPPALIGDCMCPDTATVVTPECTFTCADIEDFLSDPTLTAELNPQYLNNCGTPSTIVPEDVISNDSICGGYIITRTWKAQLMTAHGTMIKTLGCKQKFKFNPIDSSDILSPKSKVIVECGIETDPESLRNYFSDTTYFTNPDVDSAIFCSYPSIEIDSVNRYDSTLITVQLDKDSSYYMKFKLPRFRPVGPRKTGVEQFCKVFATYSDTDKIIPDDGCPNSYKFVRTWKLLNWCTGEVRDETQIIAVMDNDAPIFEAPNTIPMVSTDPWFCSARVEVPNPIDERTSDNCADTDELVWSAVVELSSFNKIVADASNNYILDGLYPGSYDVVYSLSDQCGNISTDTSNLVIKDGADPVVITKDKIIVTFTPFADSCTAKIFPYNIDVGSYDACDDSLIYEIKRLTDTSWHQFVKFSQHDITAIDDDGIPHAEHMIELRVSDRQGNYSIGWSTVRVEDKSSQIEIQCGLDSISLDCNRDFESVILDSLYAPRAMLKSCATSDLELDYSIINNTINSNCNVGEADVAYFIRGQMDTICIKHFSLGDLDSLNFIFPAEDTIVDCSVTDFGDLVVEGDECNLLAQNVDLQEFEVPNSNGICKKIIRTFTTIDWCTYRANQTGDEGIYVFRQVIKIRDTERPVITCEDETFSVGQDCGLSGFRLSAQGSDEGCSNNLSWIARIDIDGDDIFDLLLNPTIADDGNATVSIDTLVPTGTYNILWRATDDCGNFSEQLCEFTILDEKAPTPQCIGGISSAVMNTNGEVAIWAADFDIDSKPIDECGGQVTYSFSGTDPNVSSMSFTCDSILNGITVTKALRVWVWDASGNRDFCTVNFRIDDNAQVCPDVDEGMALISGTITTSMGDDLESAEVYVVDPSKAHESATMTDVTGDYMFNSNLKYLDYEVTASKSDDVSNGVSTLDLVLIQQYILSLRSFENPYQVIAADVTGDEKVSALDLVDIRRVILGNSDHFASDKSWLFVDKNQSFNSIDNPWPLRQSIGIEELRSNDGDNHFTAIKLGDVNGNAIANSLLAGTRSNDIVRVIADDLPLSNGQDAVLTFRPEQFGQIFGLQLSLNIEDVDVYSVKINGNMLPQSNYLITDKSLLISEPYPLGMNQMEISLHVIPHRDMLASEAITINEDRGLRSEIYVNESLETSELSLDYNVITNQESIDDFELYQNEPNPFSGTTTIGFYLPESSKVELSVFDITGRQLYNEKGTFDSGKNKMVIEESKLSTKGLLYYQLSAGNQVATKRMIIMN